MPVQELGIARCRRVGWRVPASDYATPTTAVQQENSADPIDQPSLSTDERRLRRAFDEALASKDVDGCVNAILDLEQAIHDWATDMLQSDEPDKARRALRSMVVRLGDLAQVGAGDPRESIAPVVDAMLRLRTRARDQRDFATSDMIRNELTAAGVEVKDTASGTSWNLAT